MASGVCTVLVHAKVMVLAAEYLQYSSWWYGLLRISIGDIMGPRTYRWHYGQQNVQYLCLSFGEGSKMYVCIGGGVGSRGTLLGYWCQLGAKQ